MKLPLLEVQYQLQVDMHIVQPIFTEDECNAQFSDYFLLPDDYLGDYQVLQENFCLFWSFLKGETWYYELDDPLLDAVS